jgi:hypothetical protein
MPLTFNPDKYRELLIKYQPKLIRTEEENERDLAIIEVRIQVSAIGMKGEGFAPGFMCQYLD